MLINLQNCLSKKQPQSVNIQLEKRLSETHLSPCSMTCEYSVERSDSYYLLTMVVSGEVEITCERCLKPFNHHYQNETTLAVCDSDAQAEKLLSQYESVVAERSQVDLEELLIDELILCCPKKHLNFNDCDNDIERFIMHSH